MAGARSGMGGVGGDGSSGSKGGGNGGGPGSNSGSAFGRQHASNQPQGIAELANAAREQMQQFFGRCACTETSGVSYLPSYT